MGVTTTQDRIVAWLTRIVAAEQPPSTIVAYNIGLGQTRRGFLASLIGATAFDEQNDDWACRAAYRPRERECLLPAKRSIGWEQVLADVVAATQTFLTNPEGQASFLGQAQAVTVGFDDGNLVRIR